MSPAQLSLLEKLLRCPGEQFPNGSDYVTRYKAIEAYFNEEVHPVVTPAASFVDGGYLTDHGPDHIRTVMARASDMLPSSKPNFLTCYEIYLLLVAIHVHDIGNMRGREGHEEAASKIIERLDPLLGTDGAEKRMITKIAQAHSGRYKGDKDKITMLQETEYLLGQAIRPRFMAALLRFADELADDRNRTKYLLLEHLPTSSEIFHRYARALQQPVIVGNSVRLTFDITSDDALRTFQKRESQVYLLDEIFERTVKMHRERLYCMRFLRPAISIDQIDVSIRVFPPRYADDPIAKIDYRIEEAGYPREVPDEIFALCPSLAQHQCGSPLNGASLRAYLEGYQ